MTTISDAIEVMGVVAACHHRTAPRMDDREAVLVTAEVWAELFEVYNLSLTDLVAAVKKRALTAPDAPEPAEIIAVAREIRRDRSDRESESERREREEMIDAKAEGRQVALQRFASRFNNA